MLKFPMFFLLGMETDKLATLVSMGFDIDLCEAILQVENLTLEEAIQRYLSNYS